MYRFRTALPDSTNINEKANNLNQYSRRFRYEHQVQIWKRNTPVSLALETATQTELVDFTFSIHPALPSGLRLNGTTGTISGSAPSRSALQQYSVTATRIDGLVLMAYISLEVQEGICMRPIKCNMLLLCAMCSVLWIWLCRNHSVVQLPAAGSAFAQPTGRSATECAASRSQYAVLRARFGQVTSK